MPPIRITLPNNWTPRPDQMRLWAYLEGGGTRADEVAHRRWGKDDISLHWAACAAHKKIGTYWHMLPEAAQARKAIWDAVNPKTGKRRIDEAFPLELRASTRNDDMFIRFKNGSTWQVIGSDNYNSLVGSPPIGVVFSEWSLANPAAWTYLRPILRENGGTAVFIWTPRGRNHATRAFEFRASDPTWFAEKMPAAIRVDGAKSDTMPDGPEAFSCITPVFTPQDLFQELKEMIEEAGSVSEGLARFNQEYLVDFDAPVPGAYFGEQVLAAQKEGRIGVVPYNPAYPVDTAWDLGIDDYTAIWFLQRVSRNRVNVIGYYECSDIGFDNSTGGGIVAEAFKTEERRNWRWGMHYLPHDVAVRELGAGGRSRRETLMSLGIKPIRVGVARDPEERINATRRLLPICHFDKEKCQAGLDHLKQHRKRWNAQLGVFGGELHGEHSHAAHAFGEFAENAGMARIGTPPKKVPTNPSDYKFNGNPVRNAPSWKVA